mgnify:CR=1 FL=1
MRFSVLRRSITVFLEVGVWNRFVGFWVNAVGFSTALLLDLHQSGVLQFPQGVDRFLPPAVEQLHYLVDGIVEVNPPVFVHPTRFFRDRSVRRRIKAYSTFASLDSGVNVGASKRKLGSG